MTQSITDAVREGYGNVARKGLGSHQQGVRSVANAFGYTDEELASIPDESNMGLSCGNPVAVASLREGETVVDLGCGGGLDVFLAAKQVGPQGLAIGIDMTGDMISLARSNAEKGGYDNVRFYLAEIEAMPIPSRSVDCVISNCVLNLCEDKDVALREVFRILRPGGRLAISDLALKQALPEALQREMTAWAGCIGGAITLDDYRDRLLRAGFADVAIVDSGVDLNAYKEALGADCGSTEAAAGTADFHAAVKDILERFDVNELAASVKVFALKPAA